MPKWREADRLAIAGGVAGIDLMEKAGRAVAEAVARAAPARAAASSSWRGPAIMAATALWRRGCSPSAAIASACMLVGERARLKGDAALAAKTWTGPVEAGRARRTRGTAPTSSIDALFGAGLDRPVEGLPRAMIEAMNAQAAPVIAVDLPSGINGTSGAVMGVAVRAAQTITFFRKKPGHLLLPGRLYCGAISVADIGIPGDVLAADRGRRPSKTSRALARSIFRCRSDGGHKYDRGHAVVVSGPSWSTGAARLAARGALRAGAGLVTIASPREALAVNAAANLAVMVRPVDGADELADSSPTGA